MNALKILAFAVIAIYVIVIILLYAFQGKLIFHPGKLSRDFKFKLSDDDDEIFLKTSDGEELNALFYQGSRSEVILYFHGNAGDLSGWQFVAEDFTAHGYNVLVFDYRGYGKSSGKISEEGLYTDAETMYNFLLKERNFATQDIIIYGRSIGSGVAIDLASKHRAKGLVLESAFSSLPKLADEKLPLLFPSLYLNFKFNNLKKIDQVTCPVIFIHGERDTLIPSSHSKKLFKKSGSQKKLIMIDQGSHNDLNSFQEYHEFLEKALPEFFSSLRLSK